jgi:hypothetical protein
MLVIINMMMNQNSGDISDKFNTAKISPHVGYEQKQIAKLYNY